MMQLSGVSARYDILSGHVNAVDKVTFAVKDNEIFGIAGESGCGKSTLLRIMYDLIDYPLEITEGEISLTSGEDERTFGTGEIRRRWWKDISYVPQGAMHVLNPVKKIDVQFYDAVGRYRKNQSRKQLRAEIVRYLGELELPPEVMDSYPHQLSGGMRQRVLIALATFLSPGIVLADEPTTALDVVVQRGILTMLARVQKKNKNSIVVVSHDMGVHYQITDRMGIMYAGQMIEVGDTAALFEAPRHPYTKMLIEALPKIGDLRAKEGIPGTPPDLKNPPKGCRFAMRCPHVQDRCKEDQPPFIDVGGEHRVACHLVKDERGNFHGTERPRD